MSITYTPLDYSASYANSLVLKNLVNSQREEFGVYGPNKFFMTVYHTKYLDKIENFTIYEDDLWMLSFPKTGSTWAQEMVWLIRHDLDYEGAKVEHKVRVPFFEFSSLKNEVKRYENIFQYGEVFTDVVDIAAKTPRPRFVKSHLAWFMLPKQLREELVKPKIVYISRNPKDVCISYYHHSKLLEGYRGNLDEFCEMFLNDNIRYAPFWLHVKDLWNRRNDQNVLYLTYEEMKKDIVGTINKTATFLNKQLSDDDITKLSEHLNFDSMKKNPSVNFEPLLENLRQHGVASKEGEFIRKGEVGSYKTEMKPEFIKRFDEWIEENLKVHNLPGECI